LSIFNPEIKLLVTSLVKSGITKPRQHTSAMPVENFSNLFLSWGENSCLTLKNLRAKTIALLLLSVMLRPSDIAPRSVVYDPISKKVSNVLFTTDQLKFHENGSLTITLFGIKNDTSRSGFDVHVAPHSEPLLCPVKCLQDYVSVTQSLRDPVKKPVFMSLTRPFEALKADAVASVLRSVIDDAGLDLKVFSAKYFRPTGATVLIESGHDPELVRSVGRWKCSSVFYDHYVHRKTPVSVTESVWPI
jgi:hypothetical protein